MDYILLLVSFTALGVKSTFAKMGNRYLTEEEIKAYVKSREPMDKAGAYGIQEKGSIFIEKINGDYFNVVGLPVCALSKMLRDEFDVEVL